MNAAGRKKTLSKAPPNTIEYIYLYMVCLSDKPFSPGETKKMLKNKGKTSCSTLVSVAVLLLIFGFVGTFIIGRIGYAQISKQLIQKRINSLKRELVVTKELIKKAQEDYYKRKIIAKQEYELIMDKHQERIVEIKERLPVYKQKLKRVINKNGVR